MNKYLFATWLTLNSSPESTADLLERVAAFDRFGPVAVYRLTGGGETMQELGKRVARLDLDPSLGDCEYVIVMELERAGLALGDDGARQAVASMLDGMGSTSYYQALFLTSEPTIATEPIADGEFGGAIQFGTFSMKDDDGDWAVASWYEDLRLPTIAEMTGANRARRLFSVAGTPKFGIFYEFTSLEAHTEYFEKPHEKYALDASHHTGRVVEQTIHTPMSPSVGERIFPA